VSDKKLMFEKTLRPCMAFLASFCISMVGGLVLTWWEWKHHPTNTELWMVPFGLILFATPLLVSLLLFVSEICNFKDGSSLDQSGSSLDNMVRDPELGMVNGVHS